MNKYKVPYLVMSILIVASLLLGGSVQVQAQSLASGQAKLAQKDKDKKDKKIKHKDRKEAAARSFQQGMLNPLMVNAQAAMVPGAAPHYFSHPNYANSPLPDVQGTPTYFGNVLQDRAYASDFPVGLGELAPVFVVNPTPLPDGFLTSFQTWNQASPGGSPFP